MYFITKNKMLECVFSHTPTLIKEPAKDKFWRIVTLARTFLSHWKQRLLRQEALRVGCIPRGMIFITSQSVRARKGQHGESRLESF